MHEQPRLSGFRLLPDITFWGTALQCKCCHRCARSMQLNHTSSEWQRNAGLWYRRGPHYASTWMAGAARASSSCRVALSSAATWSGDSCSRCAMSRCSSASLVAASARRARACPAPTPIRQGMFLQSNQLDRLCRTASRYQALKRPTMTLAMFSQSHTQMPNFPCQLSTTLGNTWFAACKLRAMSHDLQACSDYMGELGQASGQVPSVENK